MKDEKWYDVTVDKARTEKERQKARKLRESRWWQEKLKKGVCYYCGKTFPKGKLTMDHIVPLARGGKSTKGNTVVCCFKCNQDKALDTHVDIILDEMKKDNR